jgi:pimeloyl-ACP methyl ester carboxylesterase
MGLPIKGHILQGYKTKPVVVVIHGLGLNSRIWTDMLDYKILSGTLPIKLFVPGQNSENRSHFFYNSFQENRSIPLWEGLKQAGFNLMCWSEKIPYNSIFEAAKGLSEVVDTARIAFPGLPIALIGHSRGGLIARKYMEQNADCIQSLITISTPHRGSHIATLATRISPFFSKIEVNTIKNRPLQGLIKLIRSEAIHELYPDSEFLKNLKDLPSERIRYLSFGAINPFGFIQVFNKHQNLAKLIKIISSFVCLDEIIYGMGDGFVTDKSAHLPWADKHFTLDENHASILCNKTVLEVIVNMLDGL